MAIAEHHSIPLRTPTGMTKNEAVKALPIRLVRGGNYGEWAVTVQKFSQSRFLICLEADTRGGL